VPKSNWRSFQPSSVPDTPVCVKPVEIYIDIN
jgi:hypothetical protein